jgi:hypothetical protein
MTATPCRSCRRTGLTNTVFPECRRIMGQWNNCCGNCKWPDHAASCTWGDDSESDSDSEEGPSKRGGRGGRGGKGGKGGKRGRSRTKSPGGRLTRGGAVRKTPRATAGRRAIT